MCTRSLVVDEQVVNVYGYNSDLSIAIIGYCFNSKASQ